MKINWSKICDWSVVGVQAPYPLYSSGNVFAYVVDVMYRHHGLYRAVFLIERGRNLALSRATRFSDKMFAKMRRDTKAK